MKFFNEFGKFMMLSSMAHARWEMEMSNNILGNKKRLIFLLLAIIPILIGGVVFADQVADKLPEIIGGKKTYCPSHYTNIIFFASIAVGVVAGLITGCIGAGGGFIIAPALMSAGVKGILAVGTDLFHIFAKAIMGSVLHKKLGNISVSLAAVFLIGSLGGATVGGTVNRALFEKNPVLSDAFITSIYVVMLGLLGFYALTDFLSSLKTGKKTSPHEAKIAEEIPNLGKKIQSIKIPPMITFDEGITPGGRKISWLFLVFAGALVGLAASIMGVGGGFITFPVFVYVLGVSSMTTVGTDIFQIIFTAGYSGIGQYAIYGFIFYTLAMGMLLGSLLGVQIGALITKLVPGIYIRGFYAMAVLAGFTNRIFALPAKLRDLGVISISKDMVNMIDQAGIIIFFIVLGAFTAWVLWIFFSKISILMEGHR